MTVDLARPTGAQDDRPLAPPIPNVESNPPVLNETISLLHAILDQLKETHSRGERPTRGQFVLSPDGASGTNGRILIGASRIRMETLVILASGAVTFTIQTGSAAYLTLPATIAGAFTPIVLPFTYILERGSAFQILAGASTWAAYVIGYTE